MLTYTPAHVATKWPHHPCRPTTSSAQITICTIVEWEIRQQGAGEEFKCYMIWQRITFGYIAHNWAAENREWWRHRGRMSITSWKLAMMMTAIKSHIHVYNYIISPKILQYLHWQYCVGTFGEKPSSSPLVSRHRTCCVWSPPTPKFKQCSGTNILSQIFNRKPENETYMHKWHNQLQISYLASSFMQIYNQWSNTHITLKKEIL